MVLKRAHCDPLDPTLSMKLSGYLTYKTYKTYKTYMPYLTYKPC